MIKAIYTLLALLSLVLSLLSFGNTLSSCGIGHGPPLIDFGIWITPISLLGGSVFLYLSMFLWRARLPQAPGQLKREAKLLPKKVIIFLVSFIVTIMGFFLMAAVMLALAIGTEGKMPAWISGILNALFIFLAIYAGYVVNRKLGARYRTPPERGNT
jgi:hypothetical protein